MSQTEITHRTSERPQYQRHCPGCFQFKGGVSMCPHCGYEEGAPRSIIFLPHGITLGGQYRVGRVLGRPGGFGITYLGWDINLQQRVAIKEYLPREIATRQPNSLDVSVHTGEDKKGFEFGKEQFLREARIVAKLDHPNIVRVRNFFNANATAYLVMDYYEGMSLGDYLSSVRAKLEPELAIPLVRPILDGLQYVHERGLVHRDLKPHNIYLAAVGRPIVLDFGAARQAAGDRVQSMSVVLTEGYAPLEQYQRRAVQGPWTDVYGVAATLYRVIVGQAPPIALDRIGRDPMEDGGWAGVPKRMVEAFQKALAVRPNDRFQSALEFREALDAAYPDGESVEGAPPTAAPIFPDLGITRDLTGGSGGPRPSIMGSVPLDRAATTVTRSPTPLDPATLQAPAPAFVPAEPPAPPEPERPRILPIVVSAPGTPVATTIELGVDPLRSAPAPRTVSLDVPPPIWRNTPQPTRHRPSYWLAMGLIGASVLALGYVLLNPPGRSAPAAATTAAAPVIPARNVSPAEEPAPAPAPEPVAAPVTSIITSPPTVLPVMIDTPSGEIRLSEAATGGSPGGSLITRVGALSVSATEITVAQFTEFVTHSGYKNPLWQNYPCESAGGRLPEWDNPGYAQGDEFPVVCVSWADASAYARWLSKVTGASYRLPTEAEWEYLANAGSTSRYWWGDEFLSRMAACQSCPPKVPTQPAAAKTFPANPFGLYETLGNVREWTCSAYAPYTEGTAKDCSSSSRRFSLRGGSWQQGQQSLASRQRDESEADHRDVWTGFRVVRDPDGSGAASQ